MKAYIDRSVQQINIDIHSEMGKISDIEALHDNNFKRVMAGRNVLVNYLKDIVNSKFNNNSKLDISLNNQHFKGNVKDYAKNTIDELYGLYKNKKIWDILKFRNDIVNGIDKFEKNALKTIAGLCKNYFTTSSDGTLTFTSKVNSLRIGDVITGDGEYEIDYSGCTNPQIKSKVKRYAGGYTCRLICNSRNKSYLLKDQKGNVLCSALSWEGVTIRPKNSTNQNSGMRGGERMTNPRSTSSEKLNTPHEQIPFNANDYRYYEQLRSSLGSNICASYAYGVVSDVLAKKGRCFPCSAISAWSISSQSYIKNTFRLNQLNTDNPKQQIINAPAGSFLTMRYNGTHARESGVSHVMVSLGNGVYTDLFGENIRKIDFKSQVAFSGNKFSYGRSSYTLTGDSRLMSPNLGSLPEGTEQTINWRNITPNNFAEGLQKYTGADIHYIKSIISRQNNIPLSKFGSEVASISVKMVTKLIKKGVGFENKEGSNKVANNFLEAIKQNKEVIMRYIPTLTNHEYDELAKRAMGILYQESKAGGSWKYKGKEFLGHGNMGTFIRGPRVERAKDVGVAAYGLKKGEYSRGYTQIKFNQFFSHDDKNFLKSFGINDGSDLNHAGKCGIATIVGLIRRYYEKVVPMKNSPFRLNDAEVIELEFKDNTRESIARGKPLYELGGRARTEAEIQAKIKEWASKHKGLAKQTTVIRKGVRGDEFFDFVYYAWNSPSQIDYGTATPKESKTYAAKANAYKTAHIRTRT